MHVLYSMKTLKKNEHEEFMYLCNFLNKIILNV
jgi:hypothetical protein